MARELKIPGPVSSQNIFRSYNIFRLTPSEGGGDETFKTEFGFIADI